jgi:hypothetical protein
VSEVTAAAKSRAARAFCNIKRLEQEKQYRTQEQGRALRRVAELTRVYRKQYPNGLPHNALGVRYARYMCRTLAFFDSIEGRERWLDRYAPWLDARTRSRILNFSPYWYSGRSLGEHLELYDEDREDLKAWSIEACDVSEDERKEINKKKERRRGERRRRKEGVDTREQYLAKNTKSRKKLWKALKMSRAKYYRLGLHRRETGPSALLLY